MRIIRSPHHVSFAEEINVPVCNVYPKPTHLDWQQAAALPLAGLTAYRALFSRARLQPGEKVLITGIGGGVALFALQFALAHGYTDQAHFINEFKEFAGLTPAQFEAESRL